MSEPLRRPMYDDQWADYDDAFADRRTPRERARRLLIGPAVALIGAGSLGALGVLTLFLAVILRPIITGRVSVGQASALVVLTWTGLLIFALVIAGGAFLLRLRRRGLGLFAAYVLTFLAIFGLFALTFFPFGIWGLVVLHRPDVRRAFDRAPAAAKDDPPESP